MKKDGNIENSRVLFDATALGKTRTRTPDGLKIDASGNLFATGPGGVLVITPQGKHLGTIMTGQATSNCAFGDDGRTLYMTADDYLMRVKLKTKGIGVLTSAWRSSRLETGSLCPGGSSVASAFRRKIHRFRFAWTAAPSSPDFGLRITATGIVGDQLIERLLGAERVHEPAVC